MRGTIILLYHDIDSKKEPSEKEDLATRDTVVRIKEFERHMHYLSSNGYRGLSVSQYLAARNDGTNLDKTIVLTFDDGHISNYKLVLPVLRKYSFSATFFVIADNIGKPNYLGVPEIRKMISSNMEIGSHGLTHSYLIGLEASEMKREIFGSKTILEDLAGRPVRVFAYAGGHLNRKVVDCVKTAGYKAAASCIVGKNNLWTDPFLLRRIELRRGTSQESFQNAINPLHIMFFRFVDLSKTLLKHMIGLNKYEHIRNKLYFLYPFRR
jgi:peptidoglycan/xylan/chitin deacetylase (PgdA/CDA1 family)